MDRVIVENYINASSLSPSFTLSLPSSAKECYKVEESFSFLLNCPLLK